MRETPPVSFQESVLREVWLMAQIRQRDIRGPADFIFHIPNGLSVTDKVEGVHG